MGIMGWLLVGVIIIVIFTVIVWRIGVISQNPRKISNMAAPDVDTQWQSLSFTSNGSKLEGWLLQPTSKALTEAGRLPIVVVAHGWGSNRTRVLRYSRPLYESGFAVFMYDARSHGDSESIKAPSALMFREDVLAAVAAARRLAGINPNKVAVLGHSLGGFGALLALGEGLQVSSVITDSMPVRFETMVRAQLKRKHIPAFPVAYLIPMVWLRRARISRARFRDANIKSILSEHAGNAEAGLVPVLMIHSDGDDFISAEDLRQLKRQLPAGTMDTLFVSTDGHSTSDQAPAFWERVLPFLEETLAVPAKKDACGTNPQATRENI